MAIIAIGAYAIPQLLPSPNQSESPKEATAIVQTSPSTVPNAPEPSSSTTATQEAIGEESSESTIHHLVNLRNAVLATGQPQRISEYAVEGSSLAAADEKLIQQDHNGSLAQRALHVVETEELHRDERTAVIRATVALPTASGEAIPTTNIPGIQYTEQGLVQTVDFTLVRIPIINGTWSRRSRLPPAQTSMVNLPQHKSSEIEDYFPVLYVQQNLHRHPDSGNGNIDQSQSTNGVGKRHVTGGVDIARGTGFLVFTLAKESCNGNDNTQYHLDTYLHVEHGIGRISHGRHLDKVQCKTGNELKASSMKLSGNNVSLFEISNPDTNHHSGTKNVQEHKNVCCDSHRFSLRKKTSSC